MRRSLIVAAAVALVCASTALAGGWATVKLSSSPKGLAAGEPWIVNITVLQHGLASQPLCCLKPTVTISRVGLARSTSAAAGKSLTFTRLGRQIAPGVIRAPCRVPGRGHVAIGSFCMPSTMYGGAAHAASSRPVKILPWE